MIYKLFICFVIPLDQTINISTMVYSRMVLLLLILFIGIAMVTSENYANQVQEDDELAKVEVLEGELVTWMELSNKG